MTSWLVSRPRTISSSFITFAGLKKWWPMTCAGRPLAWANSSMSSVDVFDARMASGRVTRAKLARRSVFFRSMFSNTASTTMSTSSKPS